jgi:hypothetical protein
VVEDNAALFVDAGQITHPATQRPELRRQW